LRFSFKMITLAISLLMLLNPWRIFMEHGIKICHFSPLCLLIASDEWRNRRRFVLGTWECDNATVKPTCNVTARDIPPSPHCSQVRLIQVPYVWILGTFLLKTRFRYAHVPLKRGFWVYLFSESHHICWREVYVRYGCLDRHCTFWRRREYNTTTCMLWLYKSLTPSLLLGNSTGQIKKTQAITYVLNT
jgi:hypothetical protein